VRAAVKLIRFGDGRLFSTPGRSTRDLSAAPLVPAAPCLHPHSCHLAADGRCMVPLNEAHSEILNWRHVQTSLACPWFRTHRRLPDIIYIVDVVSCPDWHWHKIITAKIYCTAKSHRNTVFLKVIAGKPFAMEFVDYCDVEWNKFSVLKRLKLHTALEVTGDSFLILFITQYVVLGEIIWYHNIRLQIFPKLSGPRVKPQKTLIGDTK
jgi:hypothetical protein